MTRAGNRPRVAVLGAGIMGACTGLMLARRGVDVQLFDAAPAPFLGASRWNEGKIHLGHLYAADPSLATARRVLPGGLAFKRLVEDLVGCRLTEAVTDHDDTYLVHRNSVVTADAMAHYLAAVTSLAAAHPDARNYLADLRGARLRPLSPQELAHDYDPSRVLAGFRVPERSIATQWLADRFVAALDAQSGLRLAMGRRIEGVTRASESGTLGLDTTQGPEGPFDIVVNALWEGRLAIDATLGLDVPEERNHRYRVSVFLEAGAPTHLPSTVIATGPFGDVKNYGGHGYYLSWYPQGLQAEGGDVVPPPTPRLDESHLDRIAGGIVASLADVIPGIRRLAVAGPHRRVEGGWVYASGRGSLADRHATLHRRDRLGITRSGNYFSVDTGKYSTAPWLAQQLVAEICGD